MVVYGEILIIVNLFVNYFLFLATAKFVHFHPKRIWLILASLIGAIFSLIFFMNPLNFQMLLMLIMKLLLAFLLIRIAFGKQSKTIFLKTYLTFFGVNFLYAGFMYALWTFIEPRGMLYRNGEVYFDVSAITLAISAVLAYLIILFISYILDKRVKSNEIYNIEVEVEHRQTIVNGFIDTGNALTETFSGLPVVICQLDAIKEIIPKELHSILEKQDTSRLYESGLKKWKKRIRVVPYNVVRGDGILLAFKPDHFYILHKDTKISNDVYIAVTNQRLSQGEFNVILSNRIKV